MKSSATLVAACLPLRAKVETIKTLANHQTTTQRHVVARLADGALCGIGRPPKARKEHFPTGVHQKTQTPGAHCRLRSERGLFSGQTGSFSVAHTEIGNRSPLKALVKQGNPKRIR